MYELGQVTNTQTFGISDTVGFMLDVDGGGSSFCSNHAGHISFYKNFKKVAGPFRLEKSSVSRRKPTQIFPVVLLSTGVSATIVTVSPKDFSG